MLVQSILWICQLSGEILHPYNNNKNNLFNVFAAQLPPFPSKIELERTLEVLR